MRRPAGFTSTLTGGILLAALAVSLVASPVGAQEDDGADDPASAEAATLQVQRFDPPVAAPGADLFAAGTLTAGDSDLTEAVVELAVATEPASTRGQLGAFAVGAQTPTTVRVDAATSEQVTAAAGESAPWRLSVPLDDLNLPRAGVYPVILSATGPDGLGPLATVRTFLSWYPEDTRTQPTSITWVVPLAGYPVRDAEGVFLDDRTALSMSTGGRLRSILDGLLDAPVDWAVDAELLESAASMADGYRVRRPDGSTVAGDSAGVEAAAWFLAGARAALDDDDAVLGYARPDADALEEAGLSRDLVRSVTGAPDVAERALGDVRLRGDLAIPADGRIGAEALSTLRSAGVRTVVLADSAVPPAGPLTYTPSGLARLSTPDGAVTAVLSDSVLSSVVADPSAGGGDQLTRQRYLAETLLITQERPSDPRSIVVAPPTDWDVSAELAAELVGLTADVPWLEQQPLAALRRAPVPELERVALTDQQPGGRPGLTDRQVAGARELTELLDPLSAVLADSAATTERYRAAILRTTSSAWQRDRRTGSAVQEAVRANLLDDLDKVSILSRGTVTLSGDEGRIPVTVANDLDQSVVVEVRVTPRNPGRLTVEQPGEVRIGANRRESLEIPVRVNGAGAVPVDVQLFTTTDVAFSEQVTLSVRSTAYSRLGLGVVAAALVALVFLVSARLVRRFRASRGAPAEAGTGASSTDEP